MNGTFLNNGRKENGVRNLYRAVYRPAVSSYPLGAEYNHIEPVGSKERELKKSELVGVNNLGFVILLILIVNFLRDNIKNSGYILFKDKRIVTCILYNLFHLIFSTIIKAFLTIPAYGVYRLFLHKKINKQLLFALHFFYLFVFAIVCYSIQWNLTPLFAGASSIFLTNFLMKMHSYTITNFLLHTGVKKNYEQVVGSSRRVGSSFSNGPRDHARPECVYPANVSLKDYLRFMLCVPTLVYETRFLWIGRRRVWYIVFELFCLVLCVLGIILAFSLYILPITLEHKGETLREAVQDIFRLSVPSLFAWILVFYSLNHCWLNSLSEAVGFSNREFYSDWWNASSVRIFWRKWSIPSHEWSLRHLYIDSMYHFNVSKGTAESVLFLFNSLLGQLHLTFTFKVWYPFFVFVMICQLPLMLLNRAMRNSKRDANYILWISLMIHLPLLEILYFRSWVGDTQKPVSYTHLTLPTTPYV
eukprot:TRINITY_DN5090_c0_g1_i11.p1 TRINITY_DN5090_c0_g1~~TRINITY_DN5090_c0_g1_i11.p1  ORF type:complete len:473 (+),score=95.72 TRINITY_DN5090_c0_g1_i11:67-1485(+)